MRRAQGFSLVEVLIAVLILAIGLLGLGAVIPVVVREQRLAADAVQGISVLKSARDTAERYLRDEPGQVWLEDTQWSRPQDGYPWDPWLGGAGGTHGFDRTTGELYWTGEEDHVLPVRERLWPQQAILGTGAGEGLHHRPQFVWDIVARRVGTASSNNAPAPEASPKELQVAIFVRRIDMNIRLPRRGQDELSLFEVLTGQMRPGMGAIQQHERRVPTAVDNNGRPTRNGTNGQAGGQLTQNAYAAPLVVGASFDPGDRRLLNLDGAALSRQLAAQVGQRLVDNLGNIYTVRRVDTGVAGPNWVEVDPPVPAGVENGTPGGAAYPYLHQVVFVPQVPAAVSVFNITRPDMP